MNSIRLGLLAVFLAAFAAAGCQNTVNSTQDSEVHAQAQVITDRRVVTDGFLRDRLKIQQTAVARTTEGLLRVQVTAINDRTDWFSQVWSWMTGENPYTIAYQFTWIDESGMRVSTPLSQWETATVHPGQTLYIQGIAPRRDAVDFKLELKEMQ